MLLLLSSALALDVAEAPVSTLKDAQSRRLRLVVRDFVGPADLSWSADGGASWRPLARGIQPPFRTRPLPRGALLRIGEETASAMGLWSPADMAGLSGSGLRGARVVDLDVGADGLYAGTLGGGLARWDGDGWTHWTRREGLPGDLAIAIDATAEATWVATDHGLAVRDADGIRAWTDTDGLPDPYVQSVFVDGDRIWAGTYKGLGVLEDGRIDTLLQPWSCFSLLRGPDQRVWVGYEGLRGLPQGEPIEGVSSDEVVYDTEPLPTGIWLATRDNGLLWLEEGIAEIIHLPPSRGVYAIARSTQDLLLAAEQDGLIHLSGDRVRRYGTAEGLPHDTVNEVIPADDGRAWVGTDRGTALLNPHDQAISLPLAPLAAGIGARAAARHRSATLIATEDQVAVLGRAPRGLDALTSALGPDTVRLLADQHRVFGVTTDALIRWERGRLSRWEVPSGPVIDAVLHGDQVTLATPEGLHVWLEGAARLSARRPVPGLRAIAGAGAAIWGITEETVFLHGAVQRDWHVVPGPRDIAVGQSGAWVAADGGLYRISSEVDEVSRGWNAGRFVAVATTGGTVWAATESGLLYEVADQPQASSPRTVSDLDAVIENVVVTDLVPAGADVLVLTTEGVFLKTR